MSAVESRLSRLEARLWGEDLGTFVLADGSRVRRTPSMPAASDIYWGGADRKLSDGRKIIDWIPPERKEKPGLFDMEGPFGPAWERRVYQGKER